MPETTTDTISPHLPPRERPMADESTDKFGARARARYGRATGAARYGAPGGRTSGGGARAQYIEPDPVSRQRRRCSTPLHCRCSAAAAAAAAAAATAFVSFSPLHALPQ